MRVPGQKFFVPATNIFAGMARSYKFQLRFIGLIQSWFDKLWCNN